MNENCIFCKIINKDIPADIIYEDKLFIIFPDRNPINPGHSLLVPKMHIDSVFDMPEPQYAEIFQLAKKIAPAIKDAMNSVRTGLVIEGFGVAHAHVHLIPIYSGNELDPNRAQEATPEQMKETAKKICASLKKTA